MHIEIRTIGRKKKFYLAHSYRRQGKVVKLRVYLGSGLSSDELAARKVRAEERLSFRISAIGSIRDPFQTALSASELRELETLETRGEIAVRYLSEEDWRKFTEAFAFDTNAIEGSSVLANEVGDILERDKWPDKPKEDISETYGVAKAIEFIRKTKDPVSIPLVLELHRLVFRNSKPFAGRLRGRGVEVVIGDGRGNVIHRGAPSTQVRSLLGKLVKWYGENKKKYPPLVLAAVVHNQFENIHPFQDGNGRVGRLLLNNILLKHGLPPLNIELRNRQEYYAALQEYERSQNIRPTIELMLKEYRALKRLLKKR
ncbi:Fic family protein [Candidatus Micrarchaeota archaeon]|nr:Fic family protein [Candidatus Micrarchaeota archaeon]